MNTIFVPGPGKDGFHVHILLDADENVLVVFGVRIDHLPMPPPIAWRLAKEILDKCQQAEPESRLQSRDSSISVQAYDRKVLLEIRVPVSELVLTPSQGRELVFRLCFFAARAVGRDLPKDFPLEKTL